MTSGLTDTKIPIRPKPSSMRAGASCGSCKRKAKPREPPNNNNVEHAHNLFGVGRGDRVLNQMIRFINSSESYAHTLSDLSRDLTTYLSDNSGSLSQFGCV